MKKIFCYILLYLLFSTAVYAAGTEKYAFLKIPFGIRPMAMAGTFVAIADDPSTMFWNPAGIAKLKNSQLYLTQTIWLQDIYQGSMIYTNKVNSSSSWACAVKHLSYGVFTETTTSEPTGTGNTFQPTADQLNLGYAININKYVSTGLVLNYFSETLYDTTSSDYSLDAGIHFTHPKLPEHIAFGVSSKNFMSSFSSPIQNLTIGTAYTKDVLNFAFDFQNVTSTIALDMEMTAGKIPIYHIGVEYNEIDLFYFNFGYNTRSEFSAGGNCGAGCGIYPSKNLRIDFAYLPYEELGNSYLLALNYKF
ncbi:PorV/PorQ family protein [Candidatus Margulisiibacteriota bacterium]